MVDDTAPPILVPRLRTDRLVLRELRATDFDAYATFMASPEATKLMMGLSERRDAWRAFAAMAGAWMLTGAGWWAVERVEDGRMVGTVGAFFRGTSLGPDTEMDLELGWAVFPAFWRRGFATEAARAALAYGLAQHVVRRAVAHIHPENAASIGVARGIGMRFDAGVDFYGHRSSRYAIDRASMVPAAANATASPR